MRHTTYGYPGVKNRVGHVVVTVIALVSFTACRGHSPDSGGDQWAVPRAKCLATLTDERAAELTQILAKVQRS